ncbi:MAG: penicillin acylase family protein [Anaerolineales bacterium]|nr:penicillin acylase family protein [Anaerolineales bacterium]
MRRLGRILLGVLALLAVLLVVAGIYVYISIDDSFPQTEGEIQLSGLSAPVDVYRDAAGVPHIFASSEYDLFFAQGYVHAQDRFWQMDFQRHVGAGRLSEMLGSNTLDTDIFLRTVGWERVARQELEMLDAQTRDMLQAYADGVNAYLAERKGPQISLEYLFLSLLNPGYQPAPWEPLNTLTWGKAMAWDLRDNMDNEIERAILSSTLPPERIAELFPPYPEDHPLILPEYEFTGEAIMTEIQNQPGLPEALGPLLAGVQRNMAAVDGWLGGEPQAQLGSNSWVISGEHSASGMPLFANDPHLGASMPSIWYQVGLHCAPKGPDCDFDVVGVSFPGAPGVVIGHNERIAWGLTNVGADVMDLYIIRVNPDNENQYEVNGLWLDMEVVHEEIRIGSADTMDLPVRITHFGPIISDAYGPLRDIHETSGINLPSDYAIALSWTALEPGNTLQSILKINRAQNFDEFRQAAREFVAPSQNLLYADVDGNIGYQLPGHIPLRASDGRYPMPGWVDTFAWQGYIPFEHLPYALNPEAGYIVAANNAIVGPDYPFAIVDTWDYGYRAMRIEELILAAPGPIDTSYYQQMLFDNANLGALEIIPSLAPLQFADPRTAALRDELLAWNGDQGSDSSQALLFNYFWRQLLADIFHDELPEDYRPGGGSPAFTTVKSLLADPTNLWWDDTSTAAKETRDEVLTAAFETALADLSASHGSDPAGWAWGHEHTITFEHEVMGSFPLINRLFDRGPFPVSGGSSIVNATNWNASSGTFAVTSLPSKRSIFDLADWDASWQIHITGQSGHAYAPHYIDMAEPWAAGQMNPLPWTRSSVEAAAAVHLRLLP